MPRSPRLLVAFLVTAAIVGGCDGGANKGFTQEAYYKNETAKGTVRIFVFSYKPGMAKKDVESHGKSLMYTEGGWTEAYYYPEGASIPRDGVTLAKSMAQAWAVIEKFPGWKYQYIVSPNGSREISDKK